MADLKKIILNIFLFTILNFCIATAEEIKKIEITGNDRISNETIIVYGDIILGKDYESSDVTLIIKIWPTSYLQIRIYLTLLFKGLI